VSVAAPQRLVIDTHWLLDLWVFQDARAQALRQALAGQRLQWLACAPMRAELARVLDYPAVSRWRLARGQSVAEVLDCFDTHAQMQALPPPCRWRCRDPDDQVFIDLAWAHQAHLLSRDRAVRALAPALARAGLHVSADWPATAPPQIGNSGIADHLARHG
jgi:predicted nucleic acid-binding protein